MARKFGKKTEISLNPLDYSIYLMGEGGIGKTTVIKQVCEKMVGDDGYIFLTCGKSLWISLKTASPIIAI